MRAARCTVCGGSFVTGLRGPIASRCPACAHEHRKAFHRSRPVNTKAWRAEYFAEKKAAGLLVGGKVKRGRPSSKVNKNPPEIKVLDALCRQFVFLRDRFMCVKCLPKRRNGVRLQWSHIHTRGVHSLRWVPENSLCLCSGCHLKGHLHPTEFSRWFEEAYPQRAAYLTLLRQTPRKVDRVGMRLWLEREIAKLEGV